ncbi:fatty acid synthase alpha subunit Lsd1, partial [Coemansia biformis]
GYLGDVPAPRAVPPHVRVESTETERVYMLPKTKAQLPGDEAWLETLAGSELGWLRALLMAPVVVQGYKYASNAARRVLRPRAGQILRVALEDGQPQAVEVINGSGAKALDIAIDSADSTIRFNMYSAPRGRECRLELLFRHQAAMPYAPIHEVMEGRNERIKRFYAQVWFDNSREAEDIIAQAGHGGQLHIGRATSVDRSAIKDFCYAIGHVSDKYTAAGNVPTVAPLDFAIRAFWPALCKCLMSPVCDGDLTSLVHLSNEFRVVPGAPPMGPDQQLSSEAEIVEVTDSASGRTVRVKGHVTRAGEPIVAIDTSFFFRGQAADYSRNFRHVHEQPLELEISDMSLLALLRSREWFVPVPGMEPLIAVGTTLHFALESRYNFKSATVHAYATTCGAVLACSPSSGRIKVADVDFESADSYGSLVMRFLHKHGRPVGDRRQLFSDVRNLVTAGKRRMAVVQVPDNNQAYSDASTDHNPIHTNEYFADLVALPATIAHGMWTSAAARKCLQNVVADGQPERVVAYGTTFVDMVLPGKQLETRIHHSGVVNGRMLVDVEAYVDDTKVLAGTAEVEQAPTAFAFTGQGAHAPGMGMGLYASSRVARGVWDSADTFMRDTYGIPLLDIVQSNPTSHTVHFVGPRGARIRDNYRSMVYEYSASDGSRLITRPLFVDITETTESFTFYSPRGLLYATQFTQAAMLICEVAEFSHIYTSGVVPETAVYAGHSLGEYAGLTAIGQVFTPETAADIGFCRGLTMQQSVRRDAQGQSIYAMVAVSTARVALWFTPDDLERVVAAIKQHGDYDGLLEVVNYNVRNMQYVVSGELVLLEALGQMLSALGVEDGLPDGLAPLARSAVKAALSRRSQDAHFELQRTKATIPIPGIDVPFHSSLLHAGVWSFRKMLQSKIKPQQVSISRLCGRYIPNLTARPFDIGREYLEAVLALTGSAPLVQLLDTYDAERVACDPVYAQHVAYVLLIEVLSHQFSSPVRWIETQDVLLAGNLAVARFIEIGPSGVLCNMLRRTLDGAVYAPGGPEILCSATDMDRILFQDADVQPDKADAAPALAEPAGSSGAQALPEALQAEPDAPGAAEPSCAAREVPEAATPPLEVIRALVAYKLKIVLESVTAATAIKDLVGGKSTLQNEIVGDLQKEFGGDFPDKPEELPLAELAQSLALADGALGRVSTGLIARMLTSKMPGGYTKSSVCQHLQSAFGLGQQRQQALLLVALTMEPAARLDSEASAKDWLATAAKAYAKLAGISLSSTPAPGARRAAGSAGPVAVINSAEFTAAQKAQRQLAKRTMHALAAYLGLNIDPATDAASDSDKGGPATAPPAASAAASDLDIWAAEYGQDYCDAIRPAFSSQMVRQYDSYWNWARQDLIELYYAIIEGRITKMDLSMSSHCLRLMNRVTSSLVDVLKHIVSCSQQSSAPAQLLARKYGAGLIKQCTLGMGAAPAYQFTERHLAPRLRVNASGEHEYFEVDRPGEKSVRDYVDAVFSLGDFAKPASDIAGEALGAVLEGLGLPRAGPGKRSVRAPPPMVHLRSWAAGAACWSYDAAKSARLRAILDDICENGLSLAGRRALVTGCGRGSIGAEVLKGLLESGAQVVATTSSYSPSTTRYFQEMYQRHGSRGSSLVLLPFNQASRQDVSQLVEYIYADSSRGKGLGWDLDYVLPFAAIPELGHDITDLGPRSELAHRAMLTNVLRLLGEVASQKAKRRLDMHPTLAILPLSPNHGIFGSDGHYAESKIGLETLLHRWHSEPAWSPYVSVAGAAIGWTRGTGLMSGNNLVAECVERVGVRTFTAPEMAFNILGLLHPRAYAMAAQEPVWADMSGRFQCYPEVAGTIAALRRALAEMRSIVKVTTDDFHADFSTNADEETERVYRLRTIDPRANHRLRLPEVKRYEQLAHLRHLQGMVNLDQVVVVAGYGEVGPYGSAETRWEMEAHGEFSLEGCIELAWIMGYIKHFNGKHRKTGKVYTGWVDAQTEEPVADRHIKQRYERLVLEHTGIRLVEPEGMDGYDPSKKSLLRELQIEHDMEPFDATEEEARQFKLRNGDRVRIWENKAAGGGQWLVRLLKGATLMVPKALRFDRLVAAQVPAGWDPVRYGIPKSIADQLDRVTWYALVATTEALVRAGITDPYEMYRYVHVSEVGSSAGTALGGMNSTRRVYFERHCDRDQRPDVYQESFLTTPSAWVNMLLLSAAGPIKTTIGACASGVASIDVAVDTILSGKAKVMLAGSSDTIGEESAFEFAQMNATSNTLSEFQQGRAPSEMSRPCTSTRSGFMESEGSGIAVLMSAAIAIEMGAPIHGVLAMTGTATDKEGRSVPAPGKGVLTSAREAVPSQARIQALDIGYRRRQLELQLKQIREWAAQERKLALQDAQAASRAQPAAHPAARASQERASVPKEQLGFIDAEAKRQSDAALDLWGNSFWKRNPHISPLRGALAVWGLTVDDIGVASMHGTSTKANDTNESEIIERQLRHLGRTPGNVVFAVCQKYLTGHPKGPAAMWMLNGVMQTLRTGIVPGNRNADNIAAELESCEYIVYPSRSIQTPGIKAALLKSFGFGQVGAECLVVHPDYLLAVLSREQLDEYRSKAAKREAHVYRYWHNVLTGAHPLVQIKDAPPYTADMEEQVYLDPVGRIGRE